MSAKTPAESTPEYFERQYNNRASIPNAQEYTDRAVEGSKAAREALECRLDVPYGKSPRERIDLFPARKPGAPLFIYIHGGYWRSRSKSDFSYIAKPFVEAGLAVALPTYDLAPQVTVEHIVRQVLASVAWLYRNAREVKADRKRIVVCGHSAGGHLTAMMAAAKWSDYARDLPDDLIKGALSVSGVFDLRPLLSVSFNSEMRLDEAQVRKVSPIHYYPARAVPLHTAVGGLESDEFKRQARLIGETWPHCKGDYMEVPGTHHLSVVEALADPENALFERALKMAKAA